MEERAETRQQPPHSTEAEQSVLGSMLLDANALEIALEQLRPEDFYVPSHEQIFTAMQDLRNRGQAVDLVTVTEELERYGKLESAAARLIWRRCLPMFPPRRISPIMWASWRKRACVVS